MMGGTEEKDWEDILAQLEEINHISSTGFNTTVKVEKEEEILSKLETSVNLEEKSTELPQEETQNKITENDESEQKTNIQQLIESPKRVTPTTSRRTPFLGGGRNISRSDSEIKTHKKSASEIIDIQRYKDDTFGKKPFELTEATFHASVKPTTPTTSPNYNGETERSIPKEESSANFTRENLKIVERAESSNSSTSEEEDRAVLLDFVEKLFQCYSFNQNDVSCIASLLTKESGKRDFANILNNQRAKDMCIPSDNFTMFCHLMEVAIEGTDQLKDLHIGKMLMHMSSTYYRAFAGMHEFVQSRLRHIAIWKNVDFWSKALCDAITTERNKIISIENFKYMSPDEQEDYVEREKNIAFAIIGAFTHNMLSVGMEKNEVSKFIHKWCSFFSLTEEHEVQLMGNVESFAVQIADEESERLFKLQKEVWLQQRKEEWQRQQQQVMKRRQVEEKQKHYDGMMLPKTSRASADVTLDERSPQQPQRSNSEPPVAETTTVTSNDSPSILRPLASLLRPPIIVKKFTKSPAKPVPPPAAEEPRVVNKEQWKQDMRKQWEEEQMKRMKRKENEKLNIESQVQLTFDKEEIRRLSKDKWLEQRKAEWQVSLKERQKIQRTSVHDAMLPVKSASSSELITVKMDRSVSSADMLPSPKEEVGSPSKWKTYVPSPTPVRYEFLHSSPFRKTSSTDLLQGYRKAVGKQ